MPEDKQRCWTGGQGGLNPDGMSLTVGTKGILMTVELSSLQYVCMCVCVSLEKEMPYSIPHSTA